MFLRKHRTFMMYFLVVCWWGRDKMFTTERGRAEMYEISPTTHRQVLSLTSCTLLTRLISLSVHISASLFCFHILFPRLIVSCYTLHIHCDIFLSNQLHSFVFLSLPQTYFKAETQGEAAEATHHQHTFPGKRWKCPHGANTNTPLELDFSKRLVVNGLMVLFDGLLWCFMGGWGLVGKSRENWMEAIIFGMGIFRVRAVCPSVLVFFCKSNKIRMQWNLTQRLQFSCCVPMQAWNILNLIE